MNQKIKYTLLALLACALSYGQTHTGKLGSIAENGLHKLELTSELRSAAKDNFNHFRILDSNGNEVPYVLLNYQDELFSEYNTVRIESKTVLKDSVTSIVFKNENRRIKESITLQIANTDLRKKYAIYGSNDNKTWFGLVANKEVSGLSTHSAAEVKKTLSFPMNDYAYLRIDFDDTKTAPINILGAGNYKSRYFKRLPEAIDNFDIQINQNKEEKRTEIKLKAPMSHTIDGILFKVATTYFQRNAKMIARRTREQKKSVEEYDKVLKRFELNSNHENWFWISNVKEKEFFVHIDNQDNPPLEIESIQLFQMPWYLVTNLKSNEPYTITVNTTLSRPSYDLKNFISNETEVINEVTLEELSTVKSEEIVTEDIPFWKTRTFMWICLVLGSMVIVYVAVDLLKDVKTKGPS